NLSHRVSSYLFLSLPPPPASTLFPYTTLFRSLSGTIAQPYPRESRFRSIWTTTPPHPLIHGWWKRCCPFSMKNSVMQPAVIIPLDRKSTRLNSSHLVISYAVFCLKKKK